MFLNLFVPASTPLPFQAVFNQYKIVVRRFTDFGRDVNAAKITQRKWNQHPPCVTHSQMVNFLQHQARGENPEPDEFMKLLQLRSVTSDAMQAQFSVFV